MTIDVGDRIPAAQLTIMTENGPTPVDSSELLGKGRTVLFSVPGPFTPTCSAEHLPGYVDHHSALVAAGVDRVVCMSVNDIFVMDAWAKSSGVTDQVVMAADGNGDFTAALGLELDARAFGMGSRSQRFALIIEDGTVVEALIEPAGEFRVSSADFVLERLS